MSRFLNTSLSHQNLWMISQLSWKLIRPLLLSLAKTHASALPTINAFILFAPPHNALPASNRITLEMYSHLILKIVYALPLVILEPLT